MNAPEHMRCKTAIEMDRIDREMGARGFDRENTNYDVETDEYVLRYVCSPLVALPSKWLQERLEK